MFLDYAALALLFFVGIVMFYGIIAIHDIPYEMAVHRNHPQQDAIHVAGWISLFTLHAIWPFLWIWATLYREDRGWGFAKPTPSATTEAPTTPPPSEAKLAAMESEIKTLQARLEALEQDRQPQQTA